MRFRHETAILIEMLHGTLKPFSNVAVLIIANPTSMARCGTTGSECARTKVSRTLQDEKGWAQGDEPGAAWFCDIFFALDKDFM